MAYLKPLGALAGTAVGLVLSMSVLPALAGEVNIYSYRKEHLIRPQLEAFSKATGISYNIVTGSADALAQRMRREGINSPADVLLTLHESLGMHVDDPNRYGQTFCYDFAELDPLFDRVRARTNADIDSERNHFVRFLKAFETCPTYQAYLLLGCPGVSIETSRTLDLDERVRYQLWAVLGFLDEFGVVVEQADVPYLSTRDDPRGSWLNGRPAPPAVGPSLPPP